MAGVMLTFITVCRSDLIILWVNHFMGIDFDIAVINKHFRQAVITECEILLSSCLRYGLNIYRCKLSQNNF